MANTTNFNWETPDDTDLVKDGAAAIRTLGSAIDTSMVDLKGGTTGQILSKATNTDMDFTWITNDVGDITAVTAGTGITGGGTSGAVTITNDMATTITAAGDIVVGTGSGTYDNLPIGTTGQVLTADTTVSPYKVKWATASGGNTGLTLVKSQTVGTGVSSVEVTDAFSSTYKNYIVTLSGVVGSARGELPLILGSTTSGYYYFGTYGYFNSGTVTGANGNNAAAVNNAGMYNTTASNMLVDIQGPYLSAETSFFWRSVQLDVSTPLYGWQAQGLLNNSTSYTSFKLTPSNGTLTGGTIYVYGYNV